MNEIMFHLRIIKIACIISVLVVNVCHIFCDFLIQDLSIHAIYELLTHAILVRVYEILGTVRVIIIFLIKIIQICVLLQEILYRYIRKV